MAGKGGAESPTTAREPDFDDDQETGVTADSHTKIPDEAAPPKPPRPQSPRQQAEQTLKEAFPTIDAAVVRAVLTASGGNVEPAFNALLGMSDPESHSKEEAAPPQPPRPTADKAPKSQIESDELYARQLAEHYSGTGPQRRRPDQYAIPRARKETGLKPNELYDDREHSFIDDDLPVIKENLRKGFLETQSKVNRWVADLKKKIDGEEEFGSSSGTQGYGNQQTYNRRSGDSVRQSADRERYDADPKVLGDDFGGLELRDDEGHPTRTSSRPSANPDLFKPTPPTPANGRRVSFQDGPPEEIGEPPYRASPKPESVTKSKWQPLSAASPSPVTDHDPFSLGDSDDERDANTKSKELKSEDSERLKKAAAEAMAEDIGAKPAEEPGIKDSVATDKVATDK